MHKRKQEGTKTFENDTVFREVEVINVFKVVNRISPAVGHGSKQAKLIQLYSCESR